LFLAIFILLVLIFLLVKDKPAIKPENQSGSLADEQEQTEEEHESEDLGDVSPLSGMPCLNYQQRPLAVVLASDPAARPLAGLYEADLVLEMPVITNDITRMIAVFTCNEPKEIGPLRSARHDFISLAMGLDAVLVHWGGSHFALDELKISLMDNIDAIGNSYNAFYRKAWLDPPHNAFTSASRLLTAAKRLDYRLENEFEGYIFKNPISSQTENSNKRLVIKYSYPYNVEYYYDSSKNSYFRWRAGLREIDRNNNKQIEAKNIVVMRVYSEQIEGQYNDLDIEGEGNCQVYQNGEVIDCTWQKDGNNSESKLSFLNKKNSEEVSFVPGQLWIEVIEPHREVIWE